MLLESLPLWLKLATCAALILVAGTRLSREGAVIAEKTGLGRAWIGLLLLVIYLVNAYVLFRHGS